MGNNPGRAIATRIKQLNQLEEELARCTTPFCGRLTMIAAGVGVAAGLCKHCIQRKSRHGSAWASSLPAIDLKPYRTVAAKWLRDNRGDFFVWHAIIGLRALFDGAGRPEKAQDIKRRSAAHKARVAFARLREAGVWPDRLLATHVAVAAAIADDTYAPRDSEYQLVQVAKAVHRLASGSHYRAEWPMDDGTLIPLKIDTYPRSSGLVLRVIGKELDEICGSVTARALEEVRAAKVAKYGPHRSKLPGYKPPWMVAREKALLGRQQRAAPAAPRRGR